MNTAQIVIKRILTQEHLLQMSKVRDSVYLSSAKNPPTTEDDAKKLNNSNYYILGVYQDQKVIGSVTINVCEKELCWIPSELHSSLPNPEESIEVAKFFLLPEARSTSTLLKIFQQVHKILRINKRKYLVVSSDQKIAKIYKRMNFRSTGLLIHKNQLGKVSPLEVMVACHQHFGIYGLLDGPIKWCLYIKPAIDELLNEGKAEQSFGEKIIYQAYSLFNKPSSLYLKAFT